MLIIEGDKIQNVGYRPFLLVEALKRKKITNFEAENFKQDGLQRVIINMVGEKQNILEFSEFIKNNFPDYAKNCKIVDEKETCSSEVMYINNFRDILAVEQQSNIVQGGLQISDKIDSLRTETTENFKEMDAKYKAISEGMFTLANKIDKRMEKLEERNEIVDARMEKMDKHIEALLELLVNKK